MSTIIPKAVGNIEVKPFFNEKECQVVDGVEYYCANCGKSKVLSQDNDTGKFLFVGGPTYVKGSKTFSKDDSYILVAICKGCIIATCNAGYIPYKEEG